MKITNLMSKQLVTVDINEQLRRVKQLFNSTKFHHLLVVEKTVLVGVISDRDLLKSISPQVDSVAATTKDLAGLNKRAHQIMSRKPITLPDTATVRAAITLFNTHAISCIPIINSKNQPVGIVSWRDIMKELGNRINKLDPKQSVASRSSD